MKVITLFENKTISEEYINKHGLSLYIETSNHKILFDTGTDDTFAHNAQKLGVKLEDIDIAVISHGHYDHGGGIETFLKLNSKARICIGHGAFDSHLARAFGIFKFSIGLNKKLSSNSRFEFVDGTIKIDDELTLFGNVKGNNLMPQGNDKLLKRYSDGRVGKDNFEHEINLLINENDKNTLFCGCAHKGITNIIQSAKEISGGKLNTVIGGFHLMGMDTEKSKDFFDQFAESLISNNIDNYYTCHCTGGQAYRYLSQRMDNLNQIKTGMSIEV